MSLGSLITKARLDAGLSIDELASRTNIRHSVLLEMEIDNFNNCGGEIYAKGHLKNIAKALRADTDEFLYLYEQEQGHSVRSMREMLVESNVIGQEQQHKKYSWKVLLMISVGTLAVAALVQIIISNSSSQVRTPVQYQVTTSPSATPSAQGSYSTGTGVNVRVQATRGKSWLFVSDDQGQTLFSGEISQGDIKEFSSGATLNLKVGNAGGVDLQVNGKEIGAIGADGQVVSVSYGVDS